MKEIGLDLSNHQNAEKSKNASALVGVFIMNIVLTAAYFLEVLKGTRTIGSYAIVALLSLGPCVFAMMAYMRKKDTIAVRYISGIGFSLLYTYIMFTTTTDLSFVYVIVMFSMLIIYVDIKFSATLVGYAILVNLIRIIYIAVTRGLEPQELTHA